MSQLDPSIANKFLGKSECFTEEFIQSRMNERRGLQRDLYERSLNGLEYLAQLRDIGLNPIFKGGSAVQLLLPETIQRLSIDIDLAVEEDEDAILEILAGIQRKFDNKIYNFEVSTSEHPDFFQIFMIDIPSFFTKTSSKLRLDCLFHKPKYQVEEKYLRSFLYSSDITIKIPTIESLIGDKLTIIAPETIGKPLRKPLQYSKQLYDISTLLERSENFQMIYDAYIDVFEFEKKTHEKKQLTPLESLNDLIYICKLYACAANTPNWITDQDPLDKIIFLKQGIQRLAPYSSIDLRFTLPRARTESSKIALLGKLLKLEFKKELSRPISMDIFNSSYETINQLYKDREYMQTISNKIGEVNQEERFHFHLGEFLSTDPLGLLYWYGFFFPFDFLDDIS